jgi:hypothetical protein
MSDGSEFCQQIGKEELRLGFLDWTGNDSSMRNHHGTVLLARGSVDLKLCWKESADSQVRLIGHFRLDLGELLRQRLIRLGSKPAHVRVPLSCVR